MFYKYEIFYIILSDYFTNLHNFMYTKNGYSAIGIPVRLSKN